MFNKVCPQGMFSKAKGMNASNANLYNIIKSGLWKWTEDVVDPVKEQEHNNPYIKEDEDCLVLNVNTPKVTL